MSEQAEIRQTNLAGKIFQLSCREHLPEMRLLFREGKLSPKSGDWNNVINHDLVQAAAGEIVTAALNLPDEQAGLLFRTILIHDWEKRHDIKPEHFSEEEWKRAKELAAQIDYDPSVLAAADPGFHDRIIAGETTLLQRLQFYLDDISKGEQIVSLEERIAELSARRPDLDEEFWKKELLAGKIVERELFSKLRGKGVNIDQPEDIPSWINFELQKKYA